MFDEIFRCCLIDDPSPGLPLRPVGPESVSVGLGIPPGRRLPSRTTSITSGNKIVTALKNTFRKQQTKRKEISHILSK